MRNYKIFILFLLLSISVFSIGQYKGTIMDGLDTENYPEIKVSVISVSTQDAEKVVLTLVEEIRDGSTDPVPVPDIELLNRIELSSVNIDGQEYTVTDNKITIEGIDNFVYKWTGTYDTSFEELESKTITLNSNGKIYHATGVTSDPNQTTTGSYTEPGGIFNFGY